MSSTNQPPAEEQLFVSDGLEAELFWQKYRKAILLGAAALVVALAAVALWFVNTYNARLAAEALFANAGNPEEWREVIAKYPASAQAADAWFLVAESLREQGDIAQSTESYQKFLNAFPDHPLAGGARLGIAENLELAGKSTEALTALRDVKTRDAGSYAAAYAALLEGRIFLREGRLDEASKVFSTLVSTDSQSPAARVAGMQLDAIQPLLVVEPKKAAQ